MSTPVYRSQMVRLDHYTSGLATLRRVKFVSTFFWLHYRLRVPF